MALSVEVSLKRLVSNADPNYMRFSSTATIAVTLCLGLTGCGSTANVAAGSPPEVTTTTSTSMSDTTPSTESGASTTSTPTADPSTSTRRVRLTNITDADPGKLRAEGLVLDDASESHRWVTTADLDPSNRYAYISLSGIAEPFDSGCVQSLEVDGHRYYTDFRQWGDTDKIVFTQEDAIPSAFDDYRLLPFLDSGFAKRQQLEAELSLTMPTSELNDIQAQYTYVLDGDQALTLADKLTLLGRGIQSDLYLPSRSTGELHLIEIDGHITEIKMSASFQGEEIVKPTASYRHVTTLEIRMTIEDLSIDEPRVEADGNPPTASCERQTAPESWSQD